MTAFLTYEDVEHHVTALPRIVREHLALGPIEQEGGDSDPDVERECRVCDALGEGGTNLPKTAHARDRLHAHELWAWHEFTALSPADFDLDIGSLTGDDEFEAAADFWERVEPIEQLIREIVGALSYARCCAIYAAANASLRVLP